MTYSTGICRPGICIYLQEMDIDNRSALWQHIVLSGGSTMYAGTISNLIFINLRL